LRVTHEVEEVILDLKRCAEKEPESDERIQADAAMGSDQRTGPGRVDRRQPARLLQHHPEVVSITDIGCVVPAPSELHRLAFGGFESHAFRLLQNAEREARADRGHVLDEWTQAQERQGCGGVDGQWESVQKVERWMPG